MVQSRGMGGTKLRWTTYAAKYYMKSVALREDSNSPIKLDPFLEGVERW